MSNQTTRGTTVGDTVISSPIKRRKSVGPFLITWIILIILGVVGMVYYTNYIKESIENDISAQTKAQISELDKKYDTHIKNIDGQIVVLEESIMTLNELLSFVKDSTSNKTDNSNKLYTQLKDLKSQLDTLKKELEVLK